MGVDKVVLAVGVSVLLILLTKLKLSKRSSSAGKPKLNLPPEPWTLPVIGNVHQLFIAQSMYRAMGMLAERYGPLMRLRLGEVQFVVVSSPDAAQAVLKTNDLIFADRYRNATFENAFAEGSIAFTPYGEQWRQLRKVCTMDLLSLTRVRSLHRIREDEAARSLKDLAAAAAAGETVNLSARISKLIHDTIVRECIGSRSKYRNDYLHALETMMKQITGMNLADLFPSSRLMQMLSTGPRKALESRDRMESVFHKVVVERKEFIAGGGNDSGNVSLLDVLLTLQKEGDTKINITNQTINALLFDMFTAGSETSSSVMTWTMTELIRSPRVMAKAQAEVREAFQGKSTIAEADIAELTYLKMVIKEAMRLHCPAPLMLPHKCREACKIMGYDIPEGMPVFINVWAICRHRGYWEDAEEYWPERFENSTKDFRGNDFEFLPFGSGRRSCPGSNLGLANIELALASLIYHFDWKLPDGMEPKDIDMREASGMVGHKRTPLYARPITRIVPANV